jgi:hypothetical protein
MKMKRILLGLLAVMFSGLALAQTVLPPFITGSNLENARSIFEVGFLRIARNTAMTALAGGAQAGTALNLGYNRFTVVATAADSAQLPALSGGVMVVVTNADASDSMNVFPQTGGTINALSPNAGFAVAAGKTAIFFQAIDTSGATIWYAVLTA